MIHGFWGDITPCGRRACEAVDRTLIFWIELLLLNHPKTPVSYSYHSTRNSFCQAFSENSVKFVYNFFCKDFQNETCLPDFFVYRGQRVVKKHSFAISRNCFILNKDGYVRDCLRTRLSGGGYRVAVLPNYAANSFIGVKIGVKNVRKSRYGGAFAHLGDRRSSSTQECGYRNTDGGSFPSVFFCFFWCVFS